MPKKADKKAPAKKKKDPKKLGNLNAQKYTEEDIIKIAENIKKLAPTVCSLVEISYKLGITQSVYYDLVDRYPLVSEANDLAKAAVSVKAWRQSYEGKGFPNVMTMAIKYHDKNTQRREKEMLQEAENIKAEARIKEKKALAEQANDGNGNVLDDFHEFLEWKAKYKKNS